MSQDASAPPKSVPDSGNQDDEVEGRYKAPEQKAFQEIITADDEDESLRRHKEQLLGGAAAKGNVIVFPDDPRQVIVQKLVLVADGRADMELDLTQKLEEIKKKKFTLKEGCQFRIRFEFYVQRDIVNGLKYVQKTSRMGITVDKLKQMVGSYGPNEELKTYTTPPDNAPAGAMARGSYSVHSVFTDDYGKEHIKWDWNLEVKKDWDD